MPERGFRAVTPLQGRLRQILDGDPLALVHHTDLDTPAIPIPKYLPDPGPGMDNRVHARLADGKYQVKPTLF